MTEIIVPSVIEDHELPDGWTITKVGEIAKLLRGVSYKKAESSTTPQNGYLPVLRANNIGNGSLNFDELVYVLPERVAPEQKVRAGDIIIAMSSGSKRLVGKAAQAPMDYEGGFGAFCGLVRPSRELDHRFVGYFFQSDLYRKVISKLSSGVNINNLRRQHVEGIEMPLPPLAEQRRIVEKIEELFTRLDAGVESLEKTKALLKKYRQSVLKAAVTGELSREWREENDDELEPAADLLKRILEERREKWSGKKYKEPVAPDASNLPALPEGWEWTQIGKIFEVFVGATPSRKESDYWGGNIAWVSSGEVAFCRIKDTREKITESGLKNTSTIVHPPGTVLLGMIGEGKTRGQAAILDIEACHNQNSAAIRVSSAGLSPEYAYYFLEHQYVETRRLGSGNNQPALNKSRVGNMPFPLPPLEEQNYIVGEVERRLSVVEKLEATIEENMRRSGSLRQSILKRAFSGRLVPQNAEDEPADVLLERIREERASSGRSGGKSGNGGDEAVPSLFTERG